MPVPKKNHSRTRQNQRRANWKGKLATLTKCTNCGAMHRPHNLCEECGFYNGRQYREVAAQANTEE